ncbi:MAG: A/G-specific adenine glycosylase [Wenzhouxiangella sp.]|nr:A/G-specific adenine glycosylase [Wenzhouxiangella sp.]MCH8477578.1 A/G-specific adenine glycosylase [Wenzhouxiangella sp.]TVR97318.1 MAG: A/G-specific adenine glycosylase [Wenzhouxiangellaceae bacterium]
MADFAARLLAWWECHGRHDLPWQIDRTPYRVWLSEIMLQQTQVGTVVPYFQRFTDCFPSLSDLARADLDEVMALWSGLGYYARARNLHAAARICAEQHKGCLPKTTEELQALPGIGESTANAIIAQAHDRRAPILDGNVKRVMARHAAIAGWPGKTAVQRQLWQESESRTPPDRARDYTQAIMDLGATLCRRRKPDCANCPVASDCQALALNLVDQLPESRKPKPRPRRSTRLAVLQDEQRRIMLERRPPSGIWGGLWSLPELPHGDNRVQGQPLLSIEHHFTHFILDIHPVLVHASESSNISDNGDTEWLSVSEALSRGIPRPIRQIIEGVLALED